MQHGASIRPYGPCARVQALLDSAERLMRSGMRRGVPTTTEKQIHAWLNEVERARCPHDCARCPMLAASG